MNIWPNKDYASNRYKELLSESEQKEVLDYCKELFDKAMSAALAGDDETADDYRLQLHTWMNFYERLGIFIEYNWVGHRREFFFATDDDAWFQEDWIWQCAD